MARKGLLTERTKFAHMKQEDQESITALKERVKQQVIADILFRAPLPQLSTANLSGEQVFRAELEAMAFNNWSSLQGYSRKLSGTDSYRSSTAKVISCHND